MNRSSERTLLETFLTFQTQLQEYRAGGRITVNGKTLGIPAVVAAACYPWPIVKRGKAAQVTLSAEPTVRQRVDKSEEVIASKVRDGKSIYGVTTGVGGSANTRTGDHLALALSLLQELHVGVLPTGLYKAGSDNIQAWPQDYSVMPRSFIRSALLVRSNSLIRGNSGVRWRLLESMVDMLNKDIIPIVPLRGSVSASGDLSPLSYVIGSMIGHPNILVHCTVPGHQKAGSHPTPAPQKILPSAEGLRLHGLEPITLFPKEALGVMNGTSFSAGVAALVTFQSVRAIVLGEVCTAMATESLMGTQANFASFISEVRPHPGQIEVSATIHHLLASSSLASSTESQLQEVNISEDAGRLRQDRYALRTSPQWIGPLVEDIMSAVRTTEIECNSTTDNPLINPSTSKVHNGGNFQALSLTTAFEKTRLAIFLLGRLLFSQATELLHPGYNNGLPPNLATTDPSINVHAKGLEVAMASYVSELGWLASNVGTHVQSVEMHNQSVNSIALISGRATLRALEVLNMLIASHLYMVCQAVDLRAMQKQYNTSLESLLSEELSSHFAKHFAGNTIPSNLQSRLFSTILTSLEANSIVDAEGRLKMVAATASSTLLDFLINSGSAMQVGDIRTSTAAFCASFAERAATLLQDIRCSFVSHNAPSAPAAPLLGHTRPVYEFIRNTLGLRVHGLDNLNRFKDSLGDEPSIGRDVSVIYEAIVDERLGAAVAELFKNKPVPGLHEKVRRLARL